jgi:hypothetical protein
MLRITPSTSSRASRRRNVSPPSSRAASDAMYCRARFRASFSMRGTTSSTTPAMMARKATYTMTTFTLRWRMRFVSAFTAVLPMYDSTNVRKKIGKRWRSRKMIAISPIQMAHFSSRSARARFIDT